MKILGIINWRRVARHREEWRSVESPGSQEPVELKDKRRGGMKPTCYILFYKVNSARFLTPIFLPSPETGTKILLHFAARE